MTETAAHHPWFDTKLPRAERIAALVGAMSIDEKAAQMLHQAPAIDRLGVPEYNWWNECLHGVARAGKATVFPQAIAWGATFDRSLVGRMADAIAVEARAKFHACFRDDGTAWVEPGAFTLTVGGGHPDDPDLPSMSATIELAP